MTQVTPSDMSLVRGSRILFSHHSVGRNLIAGLKTWDARIGGGALSVVPVDDVKDANAPALLDASGGKNQDPKSKVDYFRTLFEQGRVHPQLAFMKFCYVDFNPYTDVDGLFAYYRETMEALKRQHPDVTFAHVTVPLVVRPVDLRERFNRLIGRDVWEDTANTKRFEFNQRLVKEYGNEPLFDLARAESTRPDGTRETFDYKGRSYFALTPAYTDDDGHLNAAGQDALAPEMIHFLAGALKKRSGPSS